MPYVMQARSSTTGQRVVWTAALAPDWTGATYPGPGSPLDISVHGAPPGIAGSIPLPDTDPPEWGGLVPLLDWDGDHVTAVSTDVFAIPDQSPNGNDAIIAGGFEPGGYLASDPNFNGHGSFAFPGDVPRNVTTPPLSTTTGAFTFIVVGKGESGNPSNAWLIGSNSGALAFYRDGIDGNLKAWLNPATASSNDDGGVAVSRSPFVFLGQIGNDESGADTQRQQIAVNSTTLKSSVHPLADGLPIAPSTFTAVVGVFHGGIGSTTFAWYGSVARILMFDGVLDGTQRAAVMAALGAKYGITIAP